MFAKHAVAIVALVVVALQAIQQTVIEGLPLWTHLWIAGVIVIGGAVVAREKVKPTNLGAEPVMLISVFVALLQTTQQTIPGLSQGVRTGITVLVVGLGAVIAKRATQPV